LNKPKNSNKNSNNGLKKGPYYKKMVSYNVVTKHFQR
jgi:hypothetical protein